MDDFQKLVHTRLQALPKDYIISIGGAGKITKSQALRHVEKKDQIGQTIIAVDREYFNALKTGKLYESINQ